MEQNNSFPTPDWAAEPKYVDAVLRVYRNGSWYKDIPIASKQCVILGADSTQADVVIIHPSTAPMHLALVHSRGGKIYAVDLRGEHGVRLNRTPIKRGERVSLNDGDFLYIGKSTREYVVRLDGRNLPGKKRRPSHEPDPVVKRPQTGPKSVRAKHILVKHCKSRRPMSWKSENIRRTPNEAIEHIEHLLDVIRSGKESFESVAVRESDCSSHARGGDLGTFERGKMQKLFEDASFALAPGEISGPVETASGVHLIKRVS